MDSNSRKLYSRLVHKAANATNLFAKFYWDCVIDVYSFYLSLVGLTNKDKAWLYCERYYANKRDL